MTSLRPGSLLKMRMGKPNVTEGHSTEEVSRDSRHRRHMDLSGLVSFGLFLIIVGAIFAANPDLIAHFSTWVDNMTADQSFLKPPVDLINSAVLFFGLIGASTFFVAGFRFAVYNQRRQALSDFFSGVALIVFSYLLHLYSLNNMRGLVVVAMEVVVIGVLVIIYSIIRFSLKLV